MAIVVTCTGCGRKLRLTEEHAGKTARCPACRVTFQVPSEGLSSDSISSLDPGPIGGNPLSGGSSGSVISGVPLSGSPSGGDPGDEYKLAGDLPSGAKSSSGGAATQPDKWHVRTPEGQEFGPAVKQDLDLWVAERRVTAECWLRKDGTTQWVGARELFPQLTPAAGPTGYPGQQSYGQPQYGQPQYGQPQYGQPGQAANPFRDQPPGYPPGGVNPYASPYAGGGYGAPYSYRKPHRGGMLLAMAIGGFFCCVLINIGTVIMANQDLSEMDRGQMDESGRGLTRASQVIGIVNLALYALWIFLNIVIGIANA